MSMFFGSRLNMKSVTAAEAATLAAFSILDAGDRVGGVVFDDERQVEFHPRRSARGLYALLESMAEMNQNLYSDRAVEEARGGLNAVLKNIARIAHHDHLVLIFSDFDGIDDTTHRRLAGIAAHNDLVLFLVHDPLAKEIGAHQNTIVGDGRMQAELDLGSESARQLLNRFSAGRLDQIYNWQNEINLSVLPLSAGEETLPQIRRLLAQTAPKRRVR
jgi:uncharacterized protein (DUF58 family)